MSLLSTLLLHRGCRDVTTIYYHQSGTSGADPRRVCRETTMQPAQQGARSALLTRTMLLLLPHRGCRDVTILSTTTSPTPAEPIPDACADDQPCNQPSKLVPVVQC